MERCKEYKSSSSELFEKEKAGTLIDAKFKEWVDVRCILEEYLNYIIVLMKEIHILSVEQDRIIAQT